MAKLFSKENLINIFLFFYVFSIFLDLHIFYNSISTLIRLFFISILFLIIIIKYGNKKEFKYLFGYLILYFIYILFHLLNIKNNNTLAEILYFYKMISSILVIYITYKLDINLNIFYKIMNICLLIICGSIVICNILKIGYASYDFNIIKYNVFDWFKYDDLNFLETSSKGYFHLANQVIAVIILYLPLLINKIKEKVNFFDVFILIIILLSLLMIGNRISSYVPLLVLFITVIVYIFMIIIKKEILNIKFLSIIILSIILYSMLLIKAPVNMRNKAYKNLLNGSIEDNNVIIDNEEININDEDLIKDEESINLTQINIESIFNEHLVNLNFPLIYYPYEQDKEFWDNMLKYDNYILMDSRFIEKSIIQRIVKLNNNKSDKWFGIGYDRIINIHNIEMDYVMQYYSLGIFGCILILGIYLVLYAYICIKLLLLFDTKFNFKNLMFFLSISILLISAYFSGNLFNAISVIIPFSFIIRITLVELKTNDNKYLNKILGFNIYNHSKEELINNIEKELKDKNQNIIFNINPLIVTNFYKQKNIVDEFNKQKYNIPDGIGIVMASKIKTNNNISQITGIDVMNNICMLSLKESYKIYLYGSNKKVVKETTKKLKEKYKNINIIGYSDGYISEKDALNNIIKCKPDILFVALGSPKQEKFIIDNKDELKDIRLIMPVGGSFDVISGNVKRAPIYLQRLHLEWLYRMIKEPKRIKQNIGLLKFVFLVIFKNNWYNEKSKGNKKYI